MSDTLQIEQPKPERKRGKSLVEKLAEACDEVGGLEKKGRNQEQKYAYLRAADVAKAIRHELFSRGIVILADEIEMAQERFQTNSGKSASEVTLKTVYNITDGQETLSYNAYSIARDFSDKAIFKAKTGALKYFLRGLGLIPDEKDDPETESIEGTPEENARFEQEFDQRTEGQRTLSDYQIRAWESGKSKGVRSEAQIAAFLKKHGIERIEEMSRQDFNEAIKWLLNPDKKDLTAPLQESVDAVAGPKLNFKRMFALAKEKQVPESDLKQYAYETYKVDSLLSLTQAQVTEVEQWLNLYA